MRLVFFILLILTISFSEAGYMRALVEKNWTVFVNDSKISNIELDGFFIINNSNQRVLDIETNGEIVHENELIKIKYSTKNPKKTNKIYARATVEINYKPLVSANPAVSFSPLSSYSNFNFTEEIKNQAQVLSTNSSLDTIININSWLKKNIEYNLSYLGQNLTPNEIFLKKQGVCAHYSSLMVAMLNSLGIKSRFVSGFAFQNQSFEPHAWVEVFIENKTVPADPTFEEIGGISADHVAMYYLNTHTSANHTNNQTDVFDMVKAAGGSEFEFFVNVSITPLEKKDFQKFTELGYSYDERSGDLNITISNPSSEYLISKYTFIAPAELYEQTKKIVLLEPFENRTYSYALNLSNIRSGYVYGIPFIVKTQGNKLEGTVNFFKNPLEEINSDLESGSSFCPLAFLLFSSTLVFALVLKNITYY